MCVWDVVDVCGGSVGCGRCVGCGVVGECVGMEV